MTVGAALEAAAEGIKLTSKIMDALHKERSEELENEWEKDLPELTKAIADNDADRVRAISAKYKRRVQN